MKQNKYGRWGGRIGGEWRTEEEADMVSKREKAIATGPALAALGPKVQESEGRAGVRAGGRSTLQE